jgi:FAD/FMN-containing dehydrogenase
MRYPSFIVSGLATLVNALLYGLTLGRFTLLEGRRWRGWYHNWSYDRCHRTRVVRPASEDEVVGVVRSSARVRVVGSGHSFNDGLSTPGATVSLDLLTGIVAVDPAECRVVAWAGTRLRDLNRALTEHGLAMRTLASHDAQSLAGIVSTDVHGTGRGPAHFSDAVLAMRIVDGTGTVHAVGPDDDLFRAAVGGIGAVGIITQFTLQCVPAFNLRQATWVETRRWAEAHLDELLAGNDHVSLYVYPFTDLLHVHAWNVTDAPRSPLGALREYVNHAKSAVAAALVGDGAAHLGRLPELAEPGMRTQAATNLVLHSPEGFNRSLYHLHQELEFAVPAADVWRAVEETLAIYERLYPDRDLPFLLTEVRFTPAGHDRSLLGPGRGRASAWLCLCLNQSGDVDAYFAEVERWMRGNDARMHLGKWWESGGAAELERMHGDCFRTFQRVRAAHDPEGRFTNQFTDRVLGPVRAAAGEGEEVGSAGEVR